MLALVFEETPRMPTCGPPKLLDCEYDLVRPYIFITLATFGATSVFYNIFLPAWHYLQTRSRETSHLKEDDGARVSRWSVEG